MENAYTQISLHVMFGELAQWFRTVSKKHEEKSIKHVKNINHEPNTYCM